MLNKQSHRHIAFQEVLRIDKPKIGAIRDSLERGLVQIKSPGEVRPVVGSLDSRQSNIVLVSNAEVRYRIRMRLDEVVPGIEVLLRVRLRVEWAQDLEIRSRLLEHLLDALYSVGKNRHPRDGITYHHAALSILEHTCYSSYGVHLSGGDVIVANIGRDIGRCWRHCVHGDDRKPLTRGDRLRTEEEIR